MFAQINFSNEFNYIVYTESFHWGVSLFTMWRGQWKNISYGLSQNNNDSIYIKSLGSLQMNFLTNRSLCQHMERKLVVVVNFIFWQSMKLPESCNIETLIWFNLNHSHQKCWRKKVFNILINNNILIKWCVPYTPNNLPQNWNTHKCIVNVVLFAKTFNQNVFKWWNQKFMWFKNWNLRS